MNETEQKESTSISKNIKYFEMVDIKRGGDLTCWRLSIQTTLH